MAAAGDKSNDAHPPLGAIIAEKYRIERVLGVGGMGVVVAARQLHLEREVAIKCLLPQAASNPEAVARFLREGKAAALLKSEHVVRVFDVGVGELGNGVGPYMVMEFLEGEDLSTTLEKRGPLPLGEAAELLLQACEAVGEAHSAGIVHRDLKPANLFVIRRPDGSPFIKVLDFGISKIIDEVAEAEAQSLTGTRSTLGTPVYMSPEQVRSAKKVDSRTDIWALGSILQELLTGAPPFDAPTLTGLCAMIIADQPTPLRDLCPDIPPEIDELVAACLEKDVNRRLPSVAEFGNALAPFSNRSSHFALASTVEGGLGFRPPTFPGRISQGLRSSQNNVDTVAQDPATIPHSASRIRTASGQPAKQATESAPVTLATPAAPAEPAGPGFVTSMGPATVSVPAENKRKPAGALVGGAVVLVALLGLAGWTLTSSGPTTPPATQGQGSVGQAPSAPPSASTSTHGAGGGPPDAAIRAVGAAGAGGAGGAASGAGGAASGAGGAAGSAAGSAGGTVASHGPGVRRPGKPSGPANPTSTYDPAKELSPK
jgi:serine/threonine-protein kinase